MAVNPWLQRQLDEKGGSIVNVILEVPTSKLAYARNIAQPLGRISSVSKIADTAYISIAVDDSKMGALSDIGQVHYNMPKGITLTTRKDHNVISIVDKMLGKVYLSSVEVPTSPAKFIKSSISIKSDDILIVPSGKTVDAVKDTPGAQALTGRGVKLGVIDTGFVYGMTHPMIGFRQPELYSTVPELPLDGQSHGSWCTFMAAGNEFNHPTYGKLAGVAPNTSLVHIKALTTMGFGSSESVLKAMEIAYNTGCKVVSMSLGGPSQGGVDEDPESKALKALSDKGMIFVVAAGNDGAGWTIGSPAISPAAVTVGSWGYTDDKLSSFSSRGPQSDWYEQNPDKYDKDLAKYGEDFIKPDCVSYGGQIKGKEEVIFTGGVGWFAPYYHKLADGFAGMHGTSQATPNVAGVISCLVGAGIVKNANDFKSLMKQYSKTPEYGYGIAKFSNFDIPT